MSTTSTVADTFAGVLGLIVALLGRELLRLRDRVTRLEARLNGKERRDE